MRSKWLEWDPKQKMEKIDGPAPTKPTEPSFAGFEGPIPGQISIIRLSEDSTPQTEPGPVGDLSGVPDMPAGVQLVSWEPKRPPSAIIHVGVVTDVSKFIITTLNELEARLQGKDVLAGNWSVRELVERLEQVGVKVELINRPPTVQPPFNVQKMLEVESRINAGLDVAPKVLVEYRHWIVWLDSGKRKGQ